jgi:hypothetical protein
MLPRPLLWARRRWRRLALGVLVVVVLSVLGLWILAQSQGQGVVRWVGKQAGYVVEVGSVEFPAWGRLVVRDLRVEDFAHIERLELAWTTRGLAARTVDELLIYGLEIRLGRMQEALARRVEPGSATSSSFRFRLKKLIIGQSQIVLDNLGAGIPPLPVKLGELAPLLFENLQLGGDAADPAAQEVQIALLENLTLYSPYDPLAPVLSFRTIRIGFSWAGIERKQLDLLVLEEPVIYVGPDLFWFSDRLKEAETTAAAAAGEETPWTIQNFEIRAGGLVLTRDGERAIRLPLIFETQETGLVLGNFSELRLSRAGFKIPLTNLAYPEYNLRINAMEGELFFSLPVEERGEKDLSNLTPTLKIESARWKGLEVREVRVSATFDRKGIYGQIYGLCYDGSIEGGFTVLLDQDMSWTAWASTTGVNLNPVTQLLSPEHFVMAGSVDSVFSVKARSKTIEEFTGKVGLNRPGTMEITAIDRVLADLPEEWSSLKRELSRVGLEAFRFYEYTGGKAGIRYAPPLSNFTLALDGKQGKRNFNLTWEDRGLMSATSSAKAASPQETPPPTP